MACLRLVMQVTVNQSHDIIQQIKTACGIQHSRSRTLGEHMASSQVYQ